MARYYLSAVQWLRDRNFEVLVPAYFQVKLPDEVVNLKPQPRERANPYRPVSINRRNPMMMMRPLDDPNQLQRANYSVEIMLGMFQRKVEFTIVNDEDVVEILDGLDRYMESLRADVELGNQKTVEYVRTVIKWRTEVYKHYYRYMKQNPEALKRLYPNHDPKNNLWAMIAGLSKLSPQGQELDPLRAKAFPIYDVDKVGPKERVSSPNEDDLMGSSLGLSREQQLGSDYTSEFNLDDFLNRG